ncbi:hypothetical protein GXM_06654 [Nostoc sphaeroides CCNUC1]|uniref:Uncharacterized protein n=1 Tax=Nostoc sphaeroides CCNUC1 TaxID=2653204 RepID=A0A5P8W928_9NOSO|nr:hypothetical protein GXM_06654 [Nostoc sphaeroides CCNUC1]
MVTLTSRIILGKTATPAIASNYPIFRKYLRYQMVNYYTA